MRSVENNKRHQQSPIFINIPDQFSDRELKREKFQSTSDASPREYLWRKSARQGPDLMDPSVIPPFFSV